MQDSQIIRTEYSDVIKKSYIALLLPAPCRMCGTG